MNGLELDRRNDSPVPSLKPDESDGYAYCRRPSVAQEPQILQTLEPGSPSKQSRDPRPTILILGATLAIAAVLAIVA